MSVNKVIVVGHLGRDPESRTFPDGGRVANITIATTEKWKDKSSGEIKEHTEWIKASFSGRLAEIANDYLKKGSLVYIEGALRTRKWTDKDGVERYSTEVKAETLKMLGGRSTGGTASNEQRPAQGAATQGGGNQQPQSSSHGSDFSDMDDDIPF